jgi:predicted nuclease of predicted toxin-antitoxin system
MKVLLDTCVWHGVRDALIAAQHDVIWCGDWDADPGDEDILATALQQERLLITLDKDFGTLAVLQRKPHAGILRLVNLTTRQQVAVCLRVLADYTEDLQSGAMITAELDRVRVRGSRP